MTRFRIKSDKNFRETLFIETIIFISLIGIGIGLKTYNSGFPIYVHIYGCLFLYFCDIIKLIFKYSETK